MKLTKTKTGKWAVRVYLGTVDGKIKQKYISGTDKNIVKAKAQEYERIYSHRTETVGAMLKRYINARKAFLSPSTVRDYESRLNNLKNEYSGVFEAVAIDRETLTAFVMEMQRNGLSVKTMRNYLGLLSAALADNDMSLPKIRLPERAPRRVYSPTIDDVKAIVEASKGTRLEVPVMLGICGLRRGEICALDLDHIDGQRVFIEYDLVYAPGKILTKKPPKTPQSVRTVYIPKETADLIRKQGFVIDMKPDRLTINFIRLLEKHNLPKCRFHDLRRFYAAFMHSQGFTDAEIMESGGWKTDRIMKAAYRYALTTEDKRVSMADEIAKKLQI